VDKNKTLKYSNSIFNFFIISIFLFFSILKNVNKKLKLTEEEKLDAMKMAVIDQEKKILAK